MADFNSKPLSLLDENGVLSKEAKNYPMLSMAELKKAFEIMIQTRVTDEWAVSLNRQGRMPTFAPNKGQEANSIGALLAVRHNDWFVQAFRELGGLIVRGIPLSQWYLTWLGNEMGNHLPIEKYYTLPVAVPIASQCLHAAGLGYAEKFKKSDKVVISFVGDGGTSEGDFYEAINFAGVWNAPCIFYVQNNQWAISVPRKTQSRSETIAQKAVAAGIEGVVVDGNDLLAVYAAVSIAAKKAREGGGPTLIEGITYRLGAHTTADDPTRYRTDDEVKCWLPKDPLIRLEKYLLSEKLISESEITSMKEAAQKMTMAEFEKAESYPTPKFQEHFLSMYHEIPPVLSEQMHLHEKRFLGGSK